MNKSIFDKVDETLAKEPKKPVKPLEPVPAPAPKLEPTKPIQEPKSLPQSKAKLPAHIILGTENLEIRLRVSDYALVQSLVVDGRRRLATKGFHFNERQMLWGMATALSSHLGRALSDQELVGISWLDSRMIRWGVEYGYLRLHVSRAEADQAQQLLSQVTGQAKQVRHELKLPVLLDDLMQSVQNAGKEKDLNDFEPKMAQLAAWIQQVVIPNLQAKAGLENFA